MADISSYIDYLECSYRAHHSNRMPELTIAHAKSLVIADTAKYFLSRVGEGKEVSSLDLRNRLSLAWCKVKEESGLTYDWRDLLSVAKQLTRVYTLRGGKDSVIAVNFPVEIDLLPGVKVTGDIDAILLKNNKDLEVISFDYTTFARRTTKSPQLRLLAGFFDIGIRDSKITRLARKYTFYRTGTGGLRRLNISRYSDNDTKSILGDIHKSIDDGAYLPTTNTDICKDCLHNTVCLWSQT